MYRSKVEDTVVIIDEAERPTGDDYAPFAELVELLEHEVGGVAIVRSIGHEAQAKDAVGAEPSAEVTGLTESDSIELDDEVFSVADLVGVDLTLVLDLRGVTSLLGEEDRFELTLPPNQPSLSGPSSKQPSDRPSPRLTAAVSAKVASSLSLSRISVSIAASLSAKGDIGAKSLTIRCTNASPALTGFSVFCRF